MEQEKGMSRPFTEWYRELRRFAGRLGYSKESIDSFDPESWFESFAEGKTPLEALLEDESYG
jgi:hypothetical protein